ncbi:MAG: alpha/beta hydrolase [Bacteroidota bacterium]
MKSLLLLHGALGASVQFQQLEEKLNSEFNIYCFDLKNHGSRCNGEPFTINDLTDDVLEYINSHHLDNVSIFGYSMGGYIALKLAFDHPEKIKQVLTLGTKLKWTAEIAEKETAMLQPELMKEKVPKFVEQLKQLHGKDWDKLVMHTADMMRNLALQPITSEEIKSLTQPVRLSLGDKDNMVTFDETLEAFRILPHGSLSIFPDTRHPIEKVSIDRLAFEIKSYF